jgi:hypothetical protein
LVGEFLLKDLLAHKYAGHLVKANALAMSLLLAKVKNVKNHLLASQSKPFTARLSIIP